MRIVHVRGSLVDVEIVRHACDQVREEGGVAPHGPSVRVLVNGEHAGDIPHPVWQRVRADLEAILEDDLTFEERNEAATAPSPKRDDAFASGPRGPELRALVAVHVPAMRNALMAALYVDGFEPVAVADGAQALRQLTEHRPHVVIADFELPRVAGDVLLERARRERGTCLRAAVLIGSQLPQVLVPESELADIVVGQPFGAAQLVERIRQRVGPNDEAETG